MGRRSSLIGTWVTANFCSATSQRLMVVGVVET
jgi:hypothetical protein